MSMPPRLLLSAGISGMAAALMLSLLQLFWVTPLIIEAESYEAAAESAAHIHSDEVAVGHEHPDEAWQPEEGWQRTLATASSNIVMAIGFALMLTGAYQLRRPGRWFDGFVWGFAGYLVFFAAPSLGLPPELPGTTAAELLDRQYWWLATVCSTAVGIVLLLLQDRNVLKLAGVLLLLVPHLLGAPQAAVAESLAPAELQVQFIWASALSNLAFWLMLGGSSAALLRRFDADDENRPVPLTENPHG